MCRCNVYREFETVPHRRLLDKISNYGEKAEDNILDKDLPDNQKTTNGVVNGLFSRWVEVLSGNPHGRVLGPVLFVLFINDLLDRVKSNIYLLADDTNIFQEVASRNDQDRLQQDLNSVQEWETTWLLSFHPQQ